VTPAQDQEYVAWRNLCAALKAEGIDINKKEVLADAIRAWGVKFAVLQEEKIKTAKKILRGIRKGGPSR
jgi:hypothetical protein